MSIPQQYYQQQPQPVYRYAKGAAARASSSFGGTGGGFPSSRSLGSMGDLSNTQQHQNQNNNQDAAVGTLSQSQQQQTSPRNNLTQSQIKTLVDPLVQAMKGTSFYDIMSNSSLVVVLDINASVSVCVAAAQESRASCFLVWDPFCKDTGKGYFVTILTLTNFIQILIHCHENQDQVSQLSNMPLRELLKQEFASGRTLAVDQRIGVNSRSRSSSSSNRIIMHASPDIALYDLLGIMVDNSINHVPILADAEVNPTSQEGKTSSTSNSESSPDAQPTNLLGVSFLPQLLSQVVRIINTPTFSATSTSPTNSCPYSSLFEVPLSQIASLDQNLADKLDSKNKQGTNSWLRSDETVYSALQRLIQQGVQALPVIDDRTGTIIDTFSRSDVIGLEDLGVYNLNQSCKVALDTRSKHRIIAVCHIHDTIGDVVAHFVATGVRTIFVVSSVNNSDEFVGQIQVSDLLSFLYKVSKE